MKKKIKSNSGFTLITIGYRDDYSIAFTPTEFRKLLVHGTEMVFKEDGGGDGVNEQYDKEKFFNLMTKHTRPMNHVIRTVLKIPNYTVTSLDLRRFQNLDEQRSRDILSLLAREGFLKRVGKLGKYTVYQPVIDKDTLILWIKEYYGLP